MRHCKLTANSARTAQHLLPSPLPPCKASRKGVNIPTVQVRASHTALVETLGVRTPHNHSGALTLAHAPTSTTRTTPRPFPLATDTHGSTHGQKGTYAHKHGTGPYPAKGERRIVRTPTVSTTSGGLRVVETTPMKHHNTSQRHTHPYRHHSQQTTHHNEKERTTQLDMPQGVVTHECAG